MVFHSQSKDPKVIALQRALRDRSPFYSGMCAIPDHQRFLYYSHDDILRRIDFSKAGADELDALYGACKPAEFGRNGENILDESYRKAGKMDLTSFATLFDPRSLRIHERVAKALLTHSNATMDMELYKLNVYGEGDFFKAHKDTPRGQTMFGSLVVVFPTLHKGGQFVLRHDQKEWTLDFTDKLATATEPSVCFVAFYGDTEHEVLPVTSGYRVTLTYNLYYNHIHPSAALIPTPFHIKVKQALVDLLNDNSKLPEGGYLGFGLVHEYVHTGNIVVDRLLGQLKGADRALADVCDELGLKYCLRLFYRKNAFSELNFITTEELEVDEDACLGFEAPPIEYLVEAIKELNPKQVEGIHLVGEGRFERRCIDGYPDSSVLRAVYKDPVTEVLEITPMQSSVTSKSPFMAYGNEKEMYFFYGTACMLVTVGPPESRGLREADI